MDRGVRRQRAGVRRSGENTRGHAYAAETMQWNAFRSAGKHGSWSAAAALLAGFLLRAFFVWHHPRFAGDTLVYGDIAQNLLRHGVYGLTEDHIRATLIRLPGYPLFLLACFRVFGVGNYVPVLWVQVAVDLLGCWLLGGAAQRLFGARMGLCVLWLSALCPFTANYTAAALTETLSIFCVTLGLWGLGLWLERRRVGNGSLAPAGAIGCALTGAALLRPDGGLLAAAIVPAMLISGWCAWGRGVALWRGLRDAAVASLLLCGALGLWAARNWKDFHVLQPLAPKYANDPGEDAPLGFARWYRTWGVGFGDTVRVYWVYDGSVENLNDLPPRAFDNAAQRRETAEIYARYNELTSSTPAIETDFAKLAAERVRTHPVRYYVLLPTARMLDMWLRPRTELMKLPLNWLRVRAHPARSTFAIGYAGLNLALLTLAVAGWVRWHRSERPGAVVVWAGVAFVVLRSAMLMTIDNSEPRYTLECFPVLLLLAGVAVSSRLVSHSSATEPS